MRSASVRGARHVFGGFAWADLRFHPAQAGVCRDLWDVVEDFKESISCMSCAPSQWISLGALCSVMRALQTPFFDFRAASSPEKFAFTVESR